MKKCYPAGFAAAGIGSGVKGGDKKDLGIIFSNVPASLAGVFTKNLVKAAPVVITRKLVKKGRCRALIANSGCANCLTGDDGFKDAAAIIEKTAQVLGVGSEEVAAASTGVIGQRLDVEKICRAIPLLAGRLDREGFKDFAEAIMTTDTEAKLVCVEDGLMGKGFRITGIAKGAGMICPDMATMLCFVCTDIAASPAVLQNVLQKAVDRTLNRITIDGDTSTNDTTLLMANGLSGLDADDPEVKSAFSVRLEEVLKSLANWIVKDGEGVTKVVRIRVENAATPDDARSVCYSVAHSPLVKTALFGEDPNWGRIFAAAGRAGIAIDPERMDLYFDDVMLVENGCAVLESEDAAYDVMKKNSYDIVLDLKSGNNGYWVLTSDLSTDYVKINADYRS